MKKLLVATALTISMTTASAGNIAYIPPAATAIDEPARMGGSGSWIIPLVIVAVIALAISQDDDCNQLAEHSRADINPCRK